MGVYKITNIVNSKSYIGITNNLEKRWNQHRKRYRSPDKKYPLYDAMNKYGLEKFLFEVLKENIETVEELGYGERYYIRYYNSHISNHGYNITGGGECCQYDGNPRTKLTVEDIIDIRTIYKECKMGTKECGNLYKDRISYSAFEKIGEGTTGKGIMDNVYTPENIELHKTITRLTGEKNPGALYKDSEVLEIRKYYVDHSLRECYLKYGERSKSKTSFRNIIDRGYLHIPIYSKTKKKGFLNNEEIDINNYNPVSTISESGE